MNQITLTYTLTRGISGIDWTIERSGHGDDAVEQQGDSIESVVSSAVFKATGQFVPPAERTES